MTVTTGWKPRFIVKSCFIEYDFESMTFFWRTRIYHGGRIFTILPMEEARTRVDAECAQFDNIIGNCMIDSLGLD